PATPTRSGPRREVQANGATAPGRYHASRSRDRRCPRTSYPVALLRSRMGKLWGVGCVGRGQPRQGVEGTQRPQKQLGSSLNRVIGLPEDLVRLYGLEALYGNSSSADAGSARNARMSSARDRSNASTSRVGPL